MYKNEISKKFSIKSLKDYKEDSYIWLYPSLIEEVDKKINKKIEYKFNELQKEFIEIKTPKEQENFIEKLNKFKNNYSQFYKEEIKNIYDSLVQKDFNKLKVKFLSLKGYEEELNFIDNINHFRAKFPEYYNQEINNLYSTLEVRLFTFIKKESKNSKKIDFSINFINKFLEKFNSSKYKEEIVKIKSILEVKKENNTFNKIVKAISNRDNIDNIISYCKSYTSSFSERLNKVEKIQENAELIKRIFENSKDLVENTRILRDNLVLIKDTPRMLGEEKNLKTLKNNGKVLKRDFEMVLMLCKEHINLKSKYFNKTRATPCANAKVAQNKYKEYMQVMSKYKSYQWKPFWFWEKE